MKKRVLSAMPSQTFAEGALDAAQQTGKLSYDGYKKVWSDEFNGDTGSTKEAASYTSGRVSTQNKQTFTYGLFSKLVSSFGFPTQLPPTARFKIM